jgi:hypothetical protein
VRSGAGDERSVGAVKKFPRVEAEELSESLGERRGQAAAVAAAHGQLRPVAQCDFPLPVDDGAHLTDTIYPDERRTVDARELLRVEALLQPADGLAQKVCGFLYVQPHVVAVSLNPVYLVGAAEEDAPARPDDDPFEVPRRRAAERVRLLRPVLVRLRVPVVRFPESCQLG